MAFRTKRRRARRVTLLPLVAVSGLDTERSGRHLLAEFRRQGVGRALLRGAVAVLRARGHRTMLAWVLQGDPAVRFHERIGGQRLGTQEPLIGRRPQLQTAFGWTDRDGLV